MFWLSYESFSILCDVFVKKRSFPAKAAVLTILAFSGVMELHRLRWLMNCATVGWGRGWPKWRIKLSGVKVRTPW